MFVSLLDVRRSCPDAVVLSCPPPRSGSSSPLARYDRWAPPAPPAPPERDHCGSFCRGAPFRPTKPLNLFFSVAPVAQSGLWLPVAFWCATEAPPKRHRKGSGVFFGGAARCLLCTVVHWLRCVVGFGGWWCATEEGVCATEEGLRHRASVALQWRTRVLQRQFCDQVV